MRGRFTRDQVRSGLSGVLLVVVVGAPLAASWHGLTEAGRDALGLPGLWAVLVPLVLDAAAAYSAVLALRDVLAGDAAGMNRALVWAYAFSSAGLNVWHGERTAGVQAAIFYGLASVSAVVLWDRTLRATRRDHLRRRGAVAEPTPRFRLARWLVAPGETGRAWRVAVLEGISDPSEAVTRLRTQHQVTALDAPAPEPVGELAGLSKADAVRKALAALDEQADPERVCRWLAVRGVETSRNYVYDVLRRDSGRQAAATNGQPVRLAS